MYCQFTCCTIKSNTLKCLIYFNKIYCCGNLYNLLFGRVIELKFTTQLLIIFIDTGLIDVMSMISEGFKEGKLLK